MPAFENQYYENPKYNYLGGDQKRIAKACNKYEKWIKEHPPRVRGWIKGGINVEYMMRVKAEKEKQMGW